MGKSPAGLKFPPGNGEEGKVLALLPSKPCEAMQQLHLLRQVHTPYTLSPNLPSGPAHPATCHRTSVRSQGHPSKDLPGSPRAPGMDPSVFPMALLLQDPVVLSGGCLTPGRVMWNQAGSRVVWQEADASQFSSPETSGISLGVSQNNPTAPLISYSCCTPAQQQPAAAPAASPAQPSEAAGMSLVHPQCHSPGGWGNPYICREKAHFVMPEDSNSNVKGIQKPRR